MRALWFVLAGGCYAPSIAPGGPCTTECPGDLACIAGTCREPGFTGDDAATADAKIDAGPTDSSLDATLVAYWKLDDPPGDGALDSSGRGHDATCVTDCPALVAGKLGGGYDFQATNSHALRLPDSPDFRGDVTVAAWMKPRTLAADNLSVMAKPQGTGTGNSWQLEVRDTTGKMSFSGGTPHALESPAAIMLGVWHHIAGTWDGTTKRLYIDGVLAASIDASITYDTHMVYLGADENTGALALPFDGVLDELRVYSRALSGPEIAALAQ